MQQRFLERVKARPVRGSAPAHALLTDRQVIDVHGSGTVGQDHHVEPGPGGGKEQLDHGGRDDRPQFLLPGLVDRPDPELSGPDLEHSGADIVTGPQALPDQVTVLPDRPPQVIGGLLHHRLEGERCERYGAGEGKVPAGVRVQAEAGGE